MTALAHIDALGDDGVALVTFRVDGAPVAKGRPRAFSRNGKIALYTPKKTQTYEDLIRIEAASAMGVRHPFQGECVVTVTAMIAVPASFNKTKRLAALSGVLRPTTRPDADNYAKAALDGCNGILFRDDSQVTDLIVRKRYAADPCLIVTLEAVA